MKQNIYTNAIAEFAEHVRNLNDAQKMDIAALLQAADRDPNNKEREALIERHPRADYAADWIMNRINDPEKSDLQTRYMAAQMDYEDAQETGTPLDVQRAINVRNAIAAKLKPRQRKY